jgi:hypothetical protein
MGRARALCGDVVMSSSSKKRNALKHGAAAQEVMLWSEKCEDYEALRAGLYEEWFPQGKTEEYEVNALLGLLWRRRRLERYEQIGMQKRLAAVREANETSRHIENLRSFGPKFEKAKTSEEVKELLSQLNPLYSNTIRSKWPLKEGDDPTKWGSKIASGLSEWKPSQRHEEGNEFLQVVDLDSFDQELNRIERLDAMIDRTIKRLMQIKTMKQMWTRLQPKLIDVSATKSLSAQESPEMAQSAE